MWTRHTVLLALLLLDQFLILQGQQVYCMYLSLYGHTTIEDTKLVKESLDEYVSVKGQMDKNSTEKKGVCK